MNDFELLSSINNFAETIGFDPKSPLTLEEYTDVLQRLREQNGITGFRDVGSPAIVATTELYGLEFS